MNLNALFPARVCRLFHVEHSVFNRYFIFVRDPKLVATLLLFLLVGCKSVDPSPELKDPIFADLESTLNDLRQEKANAETFKQMAKDELKTLEPGDPKIATLNADIRKEGGKIRTFEQQIRYYEIRLERRRLESRLRYAKSLNGKANYPDLAEFEAYKAHKNLRNASNNWNERVPRLKERIDTYTRQINGDPEPEVKGEGE